MSCSGLISWLPVRFERMHVKCVYIISYKEDCLSSDGGPPANVQNLLITLRYIL